MKIYGELASWFHLLTHPSDYAEEAAHIERVVEAVERHAARQREPEEKGVHAPDGVQPDDLHPSLAERDDAELGGVGQPFAHGEGVAWDGRRGDRRRVRLIAAEGVGIPTFSRHRQAADDDSGML